MPLRFKILAAFLPLFAAVLGVSLSIGSRAFTTQTETRIRGQLEVTHDIFLAQLKNRASHLATALRLAGSDHAFKEALATKDVETIQSAVVNLQQSRIRLAEALWVTDEKGAILTDTTGGARAGESIASWKVVSQALEGESTASLQQVGDRLYQLTATPLTAPDVIGVLVAGFAVNDGMAAELKRLTRSDVSFSSQGRLIASTLSTSGRALLDQQRSSFKDKEFRIFGDPGMRQAVFTAALPEVENTAAYLQNDWELAIAPLHKLRWRLLYLGLGGFTLTLLIGLRMAMGITRPVEKLSEATERLEQGDYTVRVGLKRKDEIGKLGRAFDKMVEGLQEREKIRSVLRKAVSKEIADELLQRGQIDLGGETRTVTLLFSDIRDFTSMSEALSPHELVSQLNDYFTDMSSAIESNKGVIDKYIGDAIMALFGAPLAGDDDADRAQRAALAMLDAMERHNLKRTAAGLKPWKIGIGLNSGPSVAGTLGSKDRWSYTVIGDAVNLASRLEGSTKHYGAKIVVSGFTRELTKAPFIYRTLDLVRVKGKSKPVEIFELLGESGTGPAWLAGFEEGVRGYRERKFDAAKARFEDVLRTLPGDKPASIYLERIAAIGGSAPEGWDPVHTMHEK
ncbi:MAG: HAMP domain-containing protein [Elusimicrobia bacterium]|nr:HAMP domain-containing protein [Elusimicrobiota bacterium]